MNNTSPRPAGKPGKKETMSTRNPETLNMAMDYAQLMEACAATPANNERRLKCKCLSETER